MRKTLACVAVLLALPFTTFAAPYDLIIRHGKVIDGTGNAWFHADVAIAGDRIAAIGDCSADSAKLEIDATNLVVAPGFIDVHTHVDDDIFKLPLAENFVRDGVTTIVSGNCGGSVGDVKAFFTRLEKNGSAVNNATLFGHNTVLRKLKGSVATKLTPAQLAEGKRLVDRAMLDGAIGFSTGLIYTPGTWSDTEEIIELAKPAGARGGIYATHMRSEGGRIMDAIDEALRVGREAGCRVEISHFKLPVVSANALGRGRTLKAGSDATLAKVEAARRAGMEVWLDQYPYTASATTMSTLLPDWVLEQGGDEAKKILTNPAKLPKVLADMKDQHEIRNKRKDLSYAVVNTSKGHPDFAGKTVMQVAQILKLRHANPPQTQLLTDAGKLSTTDVTMEDQYRAVIELYVSGGASGVFHSMDEVEVTNILRHPLIGVASDSGSREVGVGMPHPRGYGTNARVLGRYVRELKVMTLEDAIRKMTSQPATAFRMKDRGLLRPGAFADVTIFDPAAVADQATFENPHQYSTGIKSVLVNGTVVFDGQKMTGAKPGHPIYGPARVP
jgi:N-acyl-D-amino-acid deacylase